MPKLSSHLCECREQCGKYTPFATKTDKRRGHVKGEPMPLIKGHNRASVGASGLAIIAQNAAPQELDELKIRGLRELSDTDAATILTDRLRALETQYKRTYIERGFILYEVEERELWKFITDKDTGQAYASFNRWVCGEAPQSFSDAYESLRAVKQLRDVPREQLMEVPRKNVGVLLKLSSKVRKNAEVIKAAQTSSKKGFIAHIQSKHPDQHVEQETKLTAHPTKTQAEVIDLAIRAAGWVYGVEGRESALEILANFFLDGDCEREGYSELSNRRAFETAKAKGEVPA